MINYIIILILLILIFLKNLYLKIKKSLDDERRRYYNYDSDEDIY
jgi:hypothetical protein